MQDEHIEEMQNKNTVDQDLNSDEHKSAQCSQQEVAAKTINAQTKSIKKKDNWMTQCVTKIEALSMFIVTLLVVGLSLINIYSRINTNSIDTQNKVDNLLNHIALLEAKLDLYANNKEDMNITVNIDGVKQEGNISTDIDGDPTKPTDPNFNKSPFLGVGFYEGNTGVDNPIGLPVNIVYQYSPAELAGMKVGDIIMSIDDEKVATLDDLTNILSKHQAKDKIIIEFATTTDSGINVVKSEATLDYRGNFDIED